MPAKDFARAKSRMALSLDGHARADLARRMLTHVLGALRAVPVIAQTLVVTDSNDVARLAMDCGALVLRDPVTAQSLADVVDAALRHTHAAGAGRALVLMSDLPWVAKDDLHALLAALHGADVVLAPDRRHVHTNALALRLEGRFATSFGHAQSLAEHRARAEALGLQTSVVMRPGLALDVDDAVDLELSLAPPPDRA